MTSSPAKIEANKRNALLSSGPKTPEGKAASRRNAIKHGLTGGGIAVPIEDIARVARIAKDLRNEYEPTTTIGMAMVDHAAMLMVRLDRCGWHELTLVADQVQTAKYDFNQARSDWADELFDGLEANPAALNELRTFPEGIDRLIEEFSSLAAIDEWSPEALDRLARISDAGEETTEFGDLISGEIRRLETAKAAIDLRPIDLARQHAASLALFSTSPEAILARKYEAATVRGLNQAMKILEEGAPVEIAPVEIPQAPQVSAPSAPAAPVGSFLPGAGPQRVFDTPTMPRPSAALPIPPEPPVKPSKRPDPKKLREAMKRKHR